MQVEEVIKALDVTIPKYNCDNARKYQTLTIKREYLIKNANKLVKSNSSSLKQQNVNSLSFVQKIMP